MSSPVVVSSEGPVATILLNRPEVLNAFNLEMAEGLLSSLLKVAEQKEIRIVLIRGAGRAFSAGGDIKRMAELDDPPSFFQELSYKVHDAVLKIRQMAQPVIAVCNGPVSGVAFGLASSCDLRIATELATFHAGTTRLGLAPNGGLTYFLPRLIGRGRAQRLILTAEKVKARRAFELGLVDSVVTSETLDSEVNVWTKKLLAMAPESQRSFKQLLWEDDTDLAAHIDAERKAISASSATEDFQEGIRAFLEKRPAQFKGL